MKKTRVQKSHATVPLKGSDFRQFQSTSITKSYKYVCSSLAKNVYIDCRDELLEDVQQRKDENPLAYTNNKNKYM